MTLEEMGIEVKGTVAMISGFQEVLRGIVTEPSLDDLVSEELYITASTFFSKALTEMLRYKAFVLWSEPDTVTVQILESSEECQSWVEDAERLFEENPIESTDDSELDEFKRNNRFVREITFEQFLELTKSEFDNSNNYSVSETGLEYIFEDRLPVVEARAAGEI